MSEGALQRNVKGVVEEDRLIDLKLIFSRVLKDVEESWKWSLDLIESGVKSVPVDGCNSGTSGRHWDRNQM